MIIIGIALCHFGRPVVSKIWFALLFLLFMIPIPYVLYFSVAFPLQLLASKVTSVILNLIGMTVCKIVSLSDNRIFVQEIDAFDGSPVIDIKCHFPNALKDPVKTPGWAKPPTP